MNLHDFNDIHSHRPTGDGDDISRIVNLEPEQDADNNAWYSTGVHPWRAAEADTLWPLVEKTALHPHVVAIGECGIDALRGPDLNIQQQVFERHIELSEQSGKPLIIHAVRSWPQLIALRRKHKPRQEWIIHGFRGKARLANELLSHGFSLSFGDRFNQQAFDITPPEKRYRESDR